MAVERFSPITGSGLVAGHAPLPGRFRVDAPDPIEVPHPAQESSRIRFWPVEAPWAASNMRVVCFACGAKWDGYWIEDSERGPFRPRLTGHGLTRSAWGESGVPCTCSYGLSRWPNHAHATDEQILLALRVDMEVALQEEIRF